MRILACSFIAISFLFCGNKQRDTSSTSWAKVTDSIPSATQTTTQKSVSLLPKSFDDLLKNGQNGIFEDSTFSAIIESDFAIKITNPAFENDVVMEFTYNITVYVKDSGNWKIQEEKKIVSEYTRYKARGSEVKLQDMDGDGSKDIMLLLASDGRGNQNYALFLVKGKNLIEVKDFEELYAPVYDEKQKMIVTGSIMHGGHTEESYRIVNQSLIFLEGVSTHYDRDKEEDVVRKYTTKKKD